MLMLLRMSIDSVLSVKPAPRLKCLPPTPLSKVSLERDMDKDDNRRGVSVNDQRTDNLRSADDTDLIADTKRVYKTS